MKQITLSLVLALLLFALPAASAQDVPDYGQYEVLAVQELDLNAGLTRISAHLAPDGTQFAHIENGEVCIYALADGTWTEDHCFTADAQVLGEPEGMRWSPDGRYLTLSTYEQALLLALDTDIQVLDAGTGAITNLTDDAFEGGWLTHVAGNLDLAPRWMDDDTLIFIRYAANMDADPAAALWQQFAPAALYAVSLPAADGIMPPELRADITTPDSIFPAYLLAVDVARNRAAYNADVTSLQDGVPVWQTMLNGSGGDRVLTPGVPGLGILSMDYSEDGRYLMTQSLHWQRADFGLTVRAIDAETGKPIDIDPRFPAAVENTGPTGPVIVGAGWSPTGSAVAYIVRGGDNAEESGLYLASAPGEPGRLILAGDYFGTTCCQRRPITWAANDVIMLGRAGGQGVLLVQLGEQ